ncbi:MAG: hypothetical protein ABJ360_18165, partial [Roseobacter sp.]
QKCLQLISPLTAGRAWDIPQLSPSTARMSQTKFWILKHVISKLPATYEEYETLRRFWFQPYASGCAKPIRQCDSSVQFLGKCVHAQIVNYAQWGLMGELCGSESFANTAAWIYNNQTPLATYDTQKIMIAIGRKHAKILEGSPSSDAQQELSGKERKRRRDLKIQLKNEFENLISDPVNAGFRYRGAVNCALACKLTAEEAAKLKDLKFDYKWGAF